jgi:hypothetical protein
MLKLCICMQKGGYRHLCLKVYAYVHEYVHGEDDYMQ